MIGPKGDQEIPEQQEMDLPSCIVRLGIISDLIWIVRKLEKQADQPPLSGFRKSDEESRGFGREDRFVG